MKSFPYSALSGKEFPYHVLYAVAKSYSIKVDAKDVLTAIEFPQTTVVLSFPPYFYGGYNILQLGKQRIR